MVFDVSERVLEPRELRGLARRLDPFIAARHRRIGRRRGKGDLTSLVARCPWPRRWWPQSVAARPNHKNRPQQRRRVRGGWRPARRLEVRPGSARRRDADRRGAGGAGREGSPDQGLLGLPCLRQARDRPRSGGRDDAAHRGMDENQILHPEVMVKQDPISHGLFAQYSLRCRTRASLRTRPRR